MTIEPRSDVKLTMTDSLNFRCLSNRFVMFQATLRINQVRGEDCVDESALAQPCLPDDNDIELEPTLEELMLDLAGDGVEADVA